jgi:hypothetical protein
LKTNHQNQHIFTKEHCLPFLLGTEIGSICRSCAQHPVRTPICYKCVHLSRPTRSSSFNSSKTRSLFFRADLHFLLTRTCSGLPTGKIGNGNVAEKSEEVYYWYLYRCSFRSKGQGVRNIMNQLPVVRSRQKHTVLTLHSQFIAEC